MRGGRRDGAGRKPAGGPAPVLGVRLPGDTSSRLDAVLDPGETRSAFALAAIEAAIAERLSSR